MMCFPAFLANEDDDRGISALLRGGERNGRGVRLVRNRSTAFPSCRKVMRRNEFPDYHSMGLTAVVTLSILGENSLIHSFIFWY